jgi:alkylated DNA repair protein alkB homolog 8
MTHFSVTDGKNIAGDHDYPRIEFKNEPQAENVLKRFGYFD